MFNTQIIKKIRLDAQKNQSDVAKLLNVSRSSYAMWESNNNIFPLKRLLDFCYIFNASLDYIFGFTDSNVSCKKFDGDKHILRMKKLREEFNVTQIKMAEFLHIDQPTWSMYENGKALIGTPFLYDICKKYKVSADYLLGRTDKPKYFN